MIAQLLLAFAPTGCIAVEGERVLARDLAAAEAAFAGVPPETAFGWAPAPGARRLLQGADLIRRAAPHQLNLAAGASFCVVRPLEPLSRERLLAAMRASIPQAEARIEVVEFSGFLVPPGELEFPAGGLSRPPARDPGRPVLWRGHVRYGERRRLPVWARVRIAIPATFVAAGSAMRAGEVVEAGRLRLQSAEVFPFAEPVASLIEQAAGRRLRGAVAAGAPIPLRLLEAPPEVGRGELVRVQSSSGGATVAITARAESSGSTGDTVVVRNPESGKRFRARVEGKGAVSVEDAAGAGSWIRGRD